MAFVFRADRNIDTVHTETDVGPADYSPNKPTRSDINELISSNMRPPFNTSSPRKSPFITTVESTPGPGSYEKIIPVTQYDLYKEFPHLKKNHEKRDFYKAIEYNVLPPLYIDALENSLKIGFNTRGERFSTYSNSMCSFNTNPGPGRYNLAKSFIKPQNIKNSTTSKISFRESPTVLSSNRVATIPSKEMFGYEYQDGVPTMLPDPDSDIKTTGVKNDTIGPGQYEVSPKWDKNVLSWGRMSNKKSGSSLEVKSYYSTESNFTTKENSEEGDKRSQSLTSKVFNKFINQRYEKLKVVKDNNNKKSDFVFDTTPGPGYYTQDFNVFGVIEEEPNKGTLQCFGVRDKRFKNLKRDENANVGPGTYEGLNKPKEKKKKNLLNASIVDKTKKKAKTGYEVDNTKKEDENLIGPGSYELSKNMIKEKRKGKKIEEFGIKQKRFFTPANGVTVTPGPGSYINSTEFSTQTEEDKKVNQKNIDSLIKSEDKSQVKESQDNQDTIKKIKAEHFEVPPVGLYNPYIVKSILYKIKSNINSFQDNKKVSFSTQQKRFAKPLDQTENARCPILGPGIYYREKAKDIKQSYAPFNIGNIRFNYKIKGVPVPGPGAYEKGSFEDWNKKSHNILFV